MSRLARVAVVAVVAVVTVAVSRPVSAQLTPEQALAGMTRGINLGNTLEPPDESGWNNGPAQEYYFDDFKTAGFDAVRVPVRWDQHTLPDPPYTVDSEWLQRVEEVLDWGLERDFIVIVNAHHEDWLKNDYDNPSQRARFDSIWAQVAFHFKDKSDSLLFEMINEPYGMTKAQNDDLNSRILPIIRKTNPTRLVIYSGHEWASAGTYMQAAIPDDEYLMGYYHSYDPWEFSGLAERNWGSTADKAAVSQQFQQVQQFASSNSIPTMISEFGAVRLTDYNSRMRLYAHYVEEALRNNIAFLVWDDGGQCTNGIENECYGLYERDLRTWSDEKDILINTQIDGPTNVVATSVGDTLVHVSWLNRDTGNNSITLERADGQGLYQSIAELDNTTTSFEDTSIVGDEFYRYRIVSRYENGPDAFSYPSRVQILPTARFNFLGEPFAVPGVIQAEDYDIGGQGLTYSDTDAANVPNAYRPDEGVDIEARDDGGFHVGYVEPDEWIEYTIDVAEAGTYTLKTYVASLDGGGRLVFGFSNQSAGSPRIPDTDSWMTLEEISQDVDLEVGEQIMRVTIFSTPFFNIDRFVFEKAGSTSVEAFDEPVDLDVYPNPAGSRLHISAPLRGAPAFLTVVNVLGQTVVDTEVQDDLTDLGVERLASGVYVLTLRRGNELLGRRQFIKK